MRGMRWSCGSAAIGSMLAQLTSLGCADTESSLHYGEPGGLPLGQSGSDVLAFEDNFEEGDSPELPAEPVLATVSTAPFERGEIRGASEQERLPGSAPETGSASQPDDSSGSVGILSIPPTPAPTYSFPTGEPGTSANIAIGGSPADANVAASATHICVTARAAFACYTKSGNLVSLGSGFQAKPYTAKEFFEASGISTITSVDNDTNYAKDGRVIFNPTRNRFFLVFQSRESLGRLLMAVSKSQDPRDGWWTFADEVGTTDESAHDYNWVGCNHGYFLVSNRMISAWGSDGVETRTLHLAYTANDMVNGANPIKSQWSASNASRAAPCVNATSTSDAFWVNRDGVTSARVFGMRNGVVSSFAGTVQSSVPPVNGAQLNDGNYDSGNVPPVGFKNIDRQPQNSFCRSGKITWGSNDGKVWSGQTAANSAVRLVEMDISNFYHTLSPGIVVTKDRIFGRSASGETTISDYGWPAVATNSAGDIVVGSVRTNASIFPELRGSVWYAGQADISSSVSIKTGEATLHTGEYHMAGASPDPTTSGVYLAQQYPVPGPAWRIAVAKMLGSNMPDILPTQIISTSTMTAGSSYTAYVYVMNQGDQAMPASSGNLWLSTNDFISTSDTLLANFSAPSINPGATALVSASFTISSAQPAGTYYIGARTDTGGAASEHAEYNNQNPFLPPGRGNKSVTITSP